MKAIRVTTVAMVALAGLAQADVITVGPGVEYDFQTIQAAIDDADNGNTVVVAVGTYTGEGNRDIDFKGKAITVRSTDPNDPNVMAGTIIDCNGTEAEPHRGFYFHSGEVPDSLLAGITIRNGYGPRTSHGFPKSPLGGGICCRLNSSPTIARCVITGSTAQHGGAIYCDASSPRITHCTITHNGPSQDGGGISIWSIEGNSNPVIAHCTIAGNSAYFGAGIYCAGGNPAIVHCTISDNHAMYHAGGMENHANAVVVNCTFTDNSAPSGGAISTYRTNTVLSNCILWGDHPEEIYVGDGAPPLVSYSDIQGGYAGVGNISADPCFADPNGWDYHLKSQAGRWDAATESWVIDEATSPCIDAGDPMTPIGGELFPNGGIINMGAYGGTIEASKSYFGQPVCERIIAGDINGDCRVNFEDFRLMALHWLEAI